MKLTNNTGLPDAIYQAAMKQQSDYVTGKGDGDISATTLIAPPQIDALVREHGDALSEDVEQRLWAIMGTAMHNILEAAETVAKVEERLYGEFAGWKVSGKYDRLIVDAGTLQDYKFASVWEAIHGVKPERIAQLNVLAELAIRNGYDIKALEVVMLFRDYSKTKAQTQKDYPQQQIARIKVPLWSQDKRVAYIEERVKLHQAARSGTRIHCTDEERWVNGQKWAVMKKGRKSAVKLHDSEEDAYWHANSESNLSVEYRPGVNVRCEEYCNVAQFCPQKNKSGN